MTTTSNSPTNVSELERLKTLHNGSKQQLTFSDAEFERRLAGLRQIMAAKSLDAVILTSYHASSTTRTSCTPRSDATTRWWSPRTTPPP